MNHLAARLCSWSSLGLRDSQEACPEPLERKSREANQLSCSPPLSSPSPVPQVGSPLPAEISVPSRLPSPHSGSSKQRGCVPRSPAEKLIHTLAMGIPFPLRTLQVGKPRASETSLNLPVRYGGAGTGLTQYQEVWAVRTVVFGIRTYTANVSPRQEQNTKKWLRVTHPMLPLASS